MNELIKALHLYGLKKRWHLYLVNKVYVGTAHFERKRKLLNSIDYNIGANTKIVGPIECTGKLIIGENCWVEKNLKVNGNGCVTIGNNCDIGPEVTFQTDGHEVGAPDRRAGQGVCYNQSVGHGTWIGGRATIINKTSIGNSCIIASCACATKDVADNLIVGGIPAKVIRCLEND